MNKLIVVRHGDYGDNGWLTEDGCDQIGQLVEKLRSFVGESSVFFLSSSAPRAMHSAAILGEAFNVGIMMHHEALWSDRDHPENLLRALGFLKAHQIRAEVIVVVTHLEYANDLAPFFASKELGVGDLPHPDFTEKGEAWVLDCQQKTLTHVS